MWFYSSGEAAIIFTPQGNDLNVKVLDPVTFTVSQDTSESRYGFYFWGLIDKGIGSAGFNLVFDEATVPRLIGSGLVATTPWVGVTRGGPPSELEIVYLTGKTTLKKGAAVTLMPGELTVLRFFNLSFVRGLNYTSAPYVYFATDGRIISGPAFIPVPEPTTFCLLLSGLTAFLSRRRTRPPKGSAHTSTARSLEFRWARQLESLRGLALTERHAVKTELAAASLNRQLHNGGR
jgi:hypothetical protein